MVNCKSLRFQSRIEKLKIQEELDAKAALDAAEREEELKNQRKLTIYCDILTTRIG